MAHEEPRPPDDPLSQQLRESLRRQRPCTLGNLTCLVLLLLAPLGLFVWLMAPSPEQPRLGIVAADVLALPAEEVHLRAYLETVADLEFTRRQGHEVYFEEVTAPFAEGARRPPERTSSDADGTATATWRFPAEATQGEFLVRYVDRQRRRNADDRARVFFRPPETPLLLVDVQTTLSPVPAQTWATAHVLEIPIRPDAAAALKKIQATKYQVVYLAGEADRPRRYRLVRAWLDHHFVSQPSLPLGPVLGPQTFPREAEAAAARQQILAELRQRFTGPIVAVVGTTESATICQALGLRTLWLGPGAAPAGVLKVASWLDIAQNIP